MFERRPWSVSVRGAATLMSCASCRQWRLAGQRIDIVAVNPARGTLVLIELKKSAAECARIDRGKGGSALEQAMAYARLVHRHRRQLYPCFQRLARALAHAHDAPEALCTVELDPEHVPDALAAHPRC